MTPAEAFQLERAANPAHTVSYRSTKLRYVDDVERGTLDWDDTEVSYELTVLDRTLETQRWIDHIEANAGRVLFG